MDSFWKKNRKYLPLVVIVFVILAVAIGVVVSQTRPRSYSTNFEELMGKVPMYTQYYDKSEFKIEDEIVYSGAAAVSIESNEGNDARYVVGINVRKGYFYKVSCWMKTKDVGEDLIGGNLSVEYDYYHFGDLRGTNDWTYVEGYIRALEDRELTVCMRLGSFSNENTGKVYFDDFSITELRNLPSGININSVNTTGVITENFNADEFNYVMGYSILFVLLVGILWIVYRALKNSSGVLVFEGEYALFFILMVAFTLRIVLAPIAKGFEGDVYLFREWGKIMSSNIGDFYKIANENLGIADYPPLYMYVMGIVMKLVGIFNVEISGNFGQIVTKFPPIIADLACGVLIYRICSKLSRTKEGQWLKPKWSVFFAALYLFNPMILFDSVVWGQMDSFLTLFILLAIYSLMRHRVTMSALFFALAIMIKPQGLFAGPVLLYYVIKSNGQPEQQDLESSAKRIKRFNLNPRIKILIMSVINGGIGIFTGIYMSLLLTRSKDVDSGGFIEAGIIRADIVIILTCIFLLPTLIPIVMKLLDRGKEKLANIRNLIVIKTENFTKVAFTLVVTILVIVMPYMIKNFTFITDLMTETADRYAYASVNAYNFFSLIGLNAVGDSGIGLFKLTHYQWGMIFLTLILVSGLVLYWFLPRNYKSKHMLISLYLISGIFTFWTRMHERYLFPAIIFALIVAVMDNSKFMMKIYWLLTLTSFFNSLLILGKYTSGQSIWDYNEVGMKLISAGNVLAFILILVYIILKIRKCEDSKIIVEGDVNELES